MQHQEKSRGVRPGVHLPAGEAEPQCLQPRLPPLPLGHTDDQGLPPGKPLPGPGDNLLGLGQLPRPPVHKEDIGEMGVILRLQEAPLQGLVHGGKVITGSHPGDVEQAVQGGLWSTPAEHHAGSHGALPEGVGHVKALHAPDRAPGDPQQGLQILNALLLQHGGLHPGLQGLVRIHPAHFQQLGPGTPGGTADSDLLPCGPGQHRLEILPRAGVGPEQDLPGDPEGGLPEVVLLQEDPDNLPRGLLAAAQEVVPGAQDPVISEEDHIHRRLAEAQGHRDCIQTPPGPALHGLALLNLSQGGDHVPAPGRLLKGAAVTVADHLSCQGIQQLAETPLQEHFSAFHIPAVFLPAFPGKNAGSRAAPHLMADAGTGPVAELTGGALAHRENPPEDLQALPHR